MYHSNILPPLSLTSPRLFLLTSPQSSWRTGAITWLTCRTSAFPWCTCGWRTGTCTDRKWSARWRCAHPRGSGWSWPLRAWTSPPGTPGVPTSCRWLTATYKNKRPCQVSIGDATITCCLLYNYTEQTLTLIFPMMPRGNNNFLWVSGSVSPDDNYTVLLPELNHPKLEAWLAFIEFWHKFSLLFSNFSSHGILW